MLAYVPANLSERRLLFTRVRAKKIFRKDDQERSTRMTPSRIFSNFHTPVILWVVVFKNSMEV